MADAAAPSATAAPVRNVLTPLERVAVSAAAESAAAQQDSLAPLFANLGAVAGSSGLPPRLQQAVMQVLAQQTSLDQNLTGSDVQNAFQKSGILLEASLASGSVSQASGVPDLKAALIVLRQTLVASLGPAGAAEHPTAPATALPGAATAPAAAIRRAAIRRGVVTDAGAVARLRTSKRVRSCCRRCAQRRPMIRFSPAARPGSCSRKRCSMPGSYADRRRGAEPVAGNAAADAADRRQRRVAGGTAVKRPRR